MSDVFSCVWMNGKRRRIFNTNNILLFFTLHFNFNFFPKNKNKKHPSPSHIILFLPIRKCILFAWAVCVSSSYEPINMNSLSSFCPSCIVLAFGAVVALVLSRNAFLKANVVELIHRAKHALTNGDQYDRIKKQTRQNPWFGKENSVCIVTGSNSGMVISNFKLFVK
jgi:hypothetical protein